MEINITIFGKFNVIDSCSIWNILLIDKVYRASLEAGCYYSFTKYVEYECLYKKRQSLRDQEEIQLLKSQVNSGRVMSCKLDIADLQDIQLLENRRRLGLGELSSIALAKKTSQCFLTDDKKARALAVDVLGKEKVQTTPHLVGYCFFERYLLDGDLSIIIDQHERSLKSNWGRLTQFFNDVWLESCRLRSMVRSVQ